MFAALNYLDGKLIARTEQRHTHVEWLRFLKQIERETPKQLDLHLIVDNYCTHKQQKVRKWLSRHRRFHIHFTPTSSSWLNLVERFFGELTQDVIRDGSFTSVRQLVEDIETYLAERNLDPKPYRWKAKGEEILRKIQRAKRALAKQTGKTDSFMLFNGHHTSTQLDAGLFPGCKWGASGVTDARTQVAGTICSFPLCPSFR